MTNQTDTQIEVNLNKDIKSNNKKHRYNTMQYVKATNNVLKCNTIQHLYTKIL